MQTIHKFTLQPADEQAITLPIGAQLLSVQVQHSEIQLWAIIDTAVVGSYEQRILMVGTGHALPTTDVHVAFLGTVQLMGGDLVFHVFCPGCRAV